MTTNVRIALETPLLIRTSKRHPITQAQMQKMREAILAILERGPQNTRFFTEKFGLTKSAMSKHMRQLEEMGLIHRVQRRRVNARLPYEWHLGQCQTMAFADDAEDEGCGLPKRVHKRDWLPLNIPQQNPWSALGL